MKFQRHCHIGLLWMIVALMYSCTEYDNDSIPASNCRVSEIVQDDQVVLRAYYSGKQMDRILLFDTTTQTLSREFRLFAKPHGMIDSAYMFNGYGEHTHIYKLLYNTMGYAGKIDILSRNASGQFELDSYCNIVYQGTILGEIRKYNPSNLQIGSLEFEWTNGNVSEYTMNGIRMVMSYDNGNSIYSGWPSSLLFLDAPLLPMILSNNNMVSLTTYKENGSVDYAVNVQYLYGNHGLPEISTAQLGATVIKSRYNYYCK